MADLKQRGSARVNSGRRSGYAEWIALGAITAGAVGAIAGLARCSRGARRVRSLGPTIEPDTLTAPHGDKLRAARASRL